IVIFELLPFWRGRPEQGSVARDEIGPGIEEVAVDEEVFLFSADRREDAGHARIRAENLEDAHRMRRKGIHRTQQWRLLIKGMGGPGDERRRDAQRNVGLTAHEERRTAGIPGGVAAR